MYNYRYSPYDNRYYHNYCFIFSSDVCTDRTLLRAILLIVGNVYKLDFDLYIFDFR